MDDVETESMDEAENIEMDKAAMEESLFNAIAAHDPSGVPMVNRGSRPGVQTGRAPDKEQEKEQQEEE